MLFCEGLEVTGELLRVELAGSRPCVLLPLAGGSLALRCACPRTGQEEGLLQCYRQSSWPFPGLRKV